MLGAFRQTPKAEKHWATVVEIVLNEFSVCIESRHITTVVDAQKSVELLSCFLRNRDLIHGCLFEILIRWFFGCLVYTHRDGTQTASFLHFDDRCLESNVFVCSFAQEKPTSLFWCQQIDVLVNGLCCAFCLQALQHFSIDAHFRIDARNLHHVDFSVSIGNKLRRSIVDEDVVNLNVDRKNRHRIGRNGDWFLRKLYSANIELNIGLGGQILQAFVVVDKNEGSPTFLSSLLGIFPSVTPTKITVVPFLLFLICTRENGFHRCQQFTEVLHEEMDWTE